MGVDAAPGDTRKPIAIVGLDGLRERAGTELGVSDWVEVVQENIDTFAKLTGDEQYIHVDPERAAQGPFGATIQHGFLTLGMATGLLWSVCTVEGFATILNYGLNKVRFTAPVPAGSRIRLQVKPKEVTDLGKGAYQICFDAVVEIEGGERPACVAEPVFRYYP